MRTSMDDTTGGSDYKWVAVLFEYCAYHFLILFGISLPSDGIALPSFCRCWITLIPCRGLDESRPRERPPFPYFGLFLVCGGVSLKEILEIHGWARKVYMGIRYMLMI